MTESQNHRMVGIGRDLCGSPIPTPLPKQGRLEQAAQDLVQAGLEYLQRRRIRSLFGQPVPVLHYDTASAFSLWSTITLIQVNLATGALNQVRIKACYFFTF